MNGGPTHGMAELPPPALFLGRRTWRECDQGVAVIGHASQLRERFYAVSVEKKLKHPAVLAISETARTSLSRRMP